MTQYQLFCQGVGHRLTLLRQGAGLTQAEAAARCDLAHTTLGSLETGRNSPSAWALSRLARAYGATADYILFGGES